VSSACVQIVQQAVSKESPRECLLSLAAEKVQRWLLVFCQTTWTQSPQQHGKGDVQGGRDLRIQNESLPTCNYGYSTLPSGCWRAAYHGAYWPQKPWWSKKLQTHKPGTVSKKNTFWYYEFISPRTKKAARSYGKQSEAAWCGSNTTVYPGL